MGSWRTVVLGVVGVLILVGGLMVVRERWLPQGVAETETRVPAATPVSEGSSTAIATSRVTVVNTATATSTRTPQATMTPRATGTPFATATPFGTATAVATATVRPTVTPVGTATPTAVPTPRGYLSRYRLVSYYGSAEGAWMGVLNFREEDVLVAELRERVRAYQALSPQREVLPALHVIVTIADPWFGEDRNFNHRASLEAIESWLALAEAQGMAVVLDIQPGHAPIQEEFERIKRYLYRPHVHLALDSEYTMEMTPDGLYEVPGQVLGSLYAEQINPIQAQLQEIAAEIGINKVLIVHQFEDRMVPDKENIEDYPYVELVVDSDGFGGPDKVRDYVQYAGEPGFEYGGIKLYRNWDTPLLSPADVMGLEPPPSVVIYQ